MNNKKLNAKGNKYPNAKGNNLLTNNLLNSTIVESSAKWPNVGYFGGLEASLNNFKQFSVRNVQNYLGLHYPEYLTLFICKNWK